MSQKKTVTPNQFSIRQLVSAYNTYYRSGGVYARSLTRGVSDSDKNKPRNKKEGYPKLSFREWKKETSDDPERNKSREARKFVIKLSDFTAVSNFKDAYESGKKEHIDIKTEKDKNGNDKPVSMSADEYLNYLIENHVYDIHLRSCLSIASSGFRLYPKQQKKEKEEDEEDKSIPPPNIYYDYLIPQLGFTQRKILEPKDYIDALRSYFTSDALRIKGYNSVFPHSIRNEDKDHKGINYVFLQRLVPNYDDILKAVIVDGKSDIEIITECQNNIAKKNKNQRKQILDKSITEAILNGPPTITRTKKNGEEVEETDAKWISKLKDANDKTGKNVINEDTQKIITQVVHDLMSIKAFVSVVRSSMEAADKHDDIEKAYHDFTEMCEALDRFNTRHENIENSYEAFVKYVLDAYFLLKDTFNIKIPLKLIASSIKSKVEFKFTRSLKEKLDKLTHAYEIRGTGSEKEKEENEKFINETIALTADYCKQNTTSISIVKGYDFLDKSLEVYSNVGRYADIAALPKPYRVAMGIAIIKWINERIDLYVAENKKREVLIIDLKL